jgi:pSer/pThr/pTyr-binding forkhead associated (FHA) protein
MKSCPSCGGRNGERTKFCHACGARLPEGGEEAPLDQTGVAEPVSAQVPSSPATVEAAPVSEPTPPPPTRTPTAATCAACGYRLPPGQVVSWCPGCGRLFDVPVAGEAADSGSIPPAAPVAVVTPVPAAPTRHLASPGPGPGTEETILPPPPGWALVLLRAGERLDRFPLRKHEVILGRSDGDYNFPEDQLLSARHAVLRSRGKAFWIHDAGSRNGTFLRLSAPEELADGDVVTFGSLVLRYESAGGGLCTTSLITTDAGVKLFGSGRERARGRLVRILQDGSDGPAYPLTPSRTIVGRKLGHFLFPDDPLLSRQHAQFYERDGEMWVEDLGSSNGTMLRLRGPAELAKGTVFRIGDVTLEVAAP